MDRHKKYVWKKMQNRLLSCLITAVFAAAVILLNLCAQTAEEKFFLTADLTVEKVFELSQQSAAFIRTVEKPVEIAVMMDERTLANGGGYFLQARQILEQFPIQNPNITVRYVDLVKNPSFAAAYPKVSLTYYDILLTCGEKQEQTTLTDLFEIRADGNTGERYIASSRADQALTSAIMRLVSEKSPKVTLLTGHDEVYTQELLSLLRNNGYEAAKRNPLTEGIDGEADMIISLAPARDYEEEVLEEIGRYLKNDGKMGKYFLYAPDSRGTVLPNLNAFLSQWGIAVGTDFVVETDAGHIMENLPYMCLVDDASDEYAKKLTTQTQVLSPFGRELSVLFAEKYGYETTVLLAYSDTSAVISPDAAEEFRPSAEDFKTRPALIRSVYAQYDGAQEKKSGIFVFAASGFFEDSVLGSSSVANSEYLTVLCNAVTERGDMIAAAPKKLGGMSLGINLGQVYGLGIVFVIAVPALTMLLGLAVWRYRRNR